MTTKSIVRLEFVTINDMQKGTCGSTLGNMVKWHINCHTINAFGYSPKAYPTLNSKTLFSINYMHKRQYDKWK